MNPFPHRYEVEAGATADGDVTLASTGLPVLRSAAPSEFGGPGNRWSPETLLVGAVADCFVLTFRVIAAASRLPWTSLSCGAAGTVERVAGVTRFTELRLRARLRIADGSDEAKARQMIAKAEQSCLITNSLNAAVHLETEIYCEPDAAPMTDPEGQLEQAFINEYLLRHGGEPAAVASLPDGQAVPLLAAASTYAAGKLAEFESRAHYVHDIHGKD